MQMITRECFKDGNGPFSTHFFDATFKSFVGSTVNMR